MFQLITNWRKKIWNNKINFDFTLHIYIFFFLDQRSSYNSNVSSSFGSVYESDNDDQFYEFSQHTTDTYGYFNSYDYDYDFHD